MIRVQLRKYTLCATSLVLLSTTLAAADDWPQWRGPDRDGVWHETGLITEFAGPQIESKWRVPVSNGYSSPTVADGRVYIMDRVAEHEIERVLCFDAETGAEIWQLGYKCKYTSFGYQDGPRSSVTIADGRAFSFGAMGHFFALDAATGKELWKKVPEKEYNVRLPVWGMASAPLVEEDMVIVQMGAKEGACVVALDVKTGAERWRALDDKASYSPPIIVKQGDQRVLVAWTGNNISGLNPKSGEVIWDMETPAEKVIINISPPIVAGDRMFLTAFYDGSYMMRLGFDDAPTAEQLWRRIGRSERRTDALHSINSTPLFFDGHIYGVDSYGELRCLEADSGDRVWEDQTAVPRARWATIHMVRNEDRVWMFNEQGELIIAELSPQGFKEISRAKLIDPTDGQYSGTFSSVTKEGENSDKPLTNSTGVVWSHPAYANKHVFIRNDKELICANLAAH
jgi:hypothetical protein